MAGKSNLTLEFAAEALGDLDEIWDWNAMTWGSVHAHAYVAFLRSQTEKLTVFATPGKPVPTSGKYRYSTIKWKNRGHGHVVVFEIDGPILRVLRYFHTARDWTVAI